MNTPQLIILLSEYKNLHPEDTGKCDRMFELLEQKPEPCFSRKEFHPGHICASAWVVNPEHTHALLAHHKSLNKLMQFGGHIEAGDLNIYQSIRREIIEETGFEPLSISNEIFDVDIHEVPHRPAKQEPAHQHFDIRFLVEVPFDRPNPPEGESRQIDWFPLESITSELCEESVLQMARKTPKL